MSSQGATRSTQIAAPLPADVRVAIVVSRFNEPVTSRLLTGAVDTLQAAGIADRSIDVVWVPGTFELSLAADRLAASGRFTAIICLGAVIKGETSHDHHIATAAAAGLEAVARTRGLPVPFGVLTCETLAQAFARAGGEHGNKGSDCAAAALAMIGVLAGIDAATTLPHVATNH